MRKLSKNDELFLYAVTADVPQAPRHIFSLGYRIKKRRIIRDYLRGLGSSGPQGRRIRPKYVLIAVIAACLLLTGFGVLTLLNGFRVTDYGTHSLLYLSENISNAPQTIEKKFYIDMDTSGYEVNIVSDLYYQYWIEYRKGDEYFSIQQDICELYDAARIRLNTENCLTKPTPVNIDSWKGVYYQTFNGGHTFILNTGDYIITCLSNYDKKSTINMLKMTKFK